MVGASCALCKASAEVRCAVQLVPSRDVFFQALGTPGPQMQQDLHTLLEAYEPLLARIQEFLTDHDLDFGIRV